MASQPTLKQLRYLCAVAQSLHFGKAAKACFVTQSTLSAGINELEQALGATLLERSNKQVLLTDIGQKIVARSQLILSDIEALKEDAVRAKTPLSNTVRIGIIPTIAPFILPRVLPGLHQDFPKLQLLIREDLSENLASLLLQGELDVLLLALPYPVKNTTHYHLFNDPFVLAYPSGHPLGSIKQLKTRDLKDQDILLLENGHCLRDHALEACKLKSSQLSLTFEATSLHTIIPMVANGVGVSMLPKMAVEQGILSSTANISTKEFSEKGVWRKIGLLWRAKSPRDNEYRLLGEYFKKTSSVE
ncbi:LysR family transcriptional regulator [Gammaproteobacteria bacterium 53_120_T64]|nr:LysR family transcriptional regulator [Gammaproteobacteria bacterium 53_120_T64]